MRILCYGDSNTWGFVPVHEPPAPRHPAPHRWPHAMAALLDDVELVEEGLNGRTTDAADPDHPELQGAGLDGAAYLPACLASHLPLDWVVVMLGTNDLKAKFARTPARIAAGAGSLLRMIHQIGGGIGTPYASPRALLVCPPPLGAMTHFAETFAGGHAKALALPPLYRGVAAAEGAAFLDAGGAIATDGVDGLHLSAVAQRALGAAVAHTIRNL